MKVAIVHDDLVQWGGAERVLMGIAEVFPEAPIYTAVYNQDNALLKKKLAGKKIITSFMQKIPFWERFYRALLPVYPIAFEQFDFSGYDLVISQTTKFAKAVITKPETTHICYIHTPPRFLWNFSGERASKILSPYLSFLRFYDRLASYRVDYFFAGSKNCRQRVEKIYRRDSKVLPPFVDLESFDWYQRFDGGYYLFVARLNSYKRGDVVVEAFNRLGLPLKIVGVGPESGKLQSLAKENIEFLGFVDELLLNNLLAGCKALVVTAEEDFGLTPLEAQAFGKPVIAYGAGGALETVIENKTGIFFREQTAECLAGAVKRAENFNFYPGDCRKNAEHFSKEIFQRRLKQLAVKS